MKKRNFSGCLFLLFVVFCLAFSLPVSAENSDGEAAVGREVFIHSTGVVFFADGNQLCSALLGEDGIPYEMVVEDILPFEISAIAVSGNDLYLNSEAGIYRIDLTVYQQGNAAALKVSGDTPNEGFYVFGDYVYYKYGQSIYRAGTEGSGREKLAAGAEDFVMTEEGIYYTEEYGGLFFIKPDGTGRELLCETPEESRILHDGSYLYFWAEGDDAMGYYSIVNDRSGSLELSRKLSKYYVFAAPEYFLYEDEDFDTVCRYDLISGEETELSEIDTIPFKEEGVYHDGFIYDFDPWKEEMVCMNPVKDTVSRVALEQSAEAEGRNAGTAESEEQYESSDDYEITEGVVVSASEGTALLSGLHFQIYLPIDGNWDWEAIDADSFRIYHVPSSDAGYGGTLVTIKAFDWGDSSYSEFPSWKIAGLSEAKKYVAIFPTDLQTDPQNVEMADQYQQLLQYMHRMNTEDENNPFIVLDF